MILSNRFLLPSYAQTNRLVFVSFTRSKFCFVTLISTHPDMKAVLLLLSVAFFVATLSLPWPFKGKCWFISFV